jgi:ABC-2 type transport system permease protein
VPIYTQTYRRYDGQPRRHFRWLVVIEQEMKTLAKFRVFKILVLLACLHIILRLLQIVAYDVLAQDPNNPLQIVFANLDVAYIDPSTFFSFLYLQTTILFIIMLYSGAGMVCNDFKNNLMEVYFSKPLTWVDYCLGKILTLVLLGLALTAVPGIILVGLHNLLLPSMETLYASWWWPIAITAYSFVIIIPMTLGILACSSLLPSQNYAAITVIMALVANSSLGVLFASMLKQRDYMAISFPLAMRRIGETVFDDKRILFSLAWYWCLLYVAVVCLIALVIILRKVRRAEIAK